MNDSRVVTPPRSAAWLLADQALEGKLLEKLKDWRGQGLSYGAIAGELRDAGAHVSDESVRIWCRRFGLEVNLEVAK